MQKRQLWRETGAIWVVLGFLVACLAGVASASEDVPDVDPTGVSDPVERKFYQELRELREKQKHQRQELASQDLSPRDRVEKRRAILIQDHKEMAELEAAYQAKLSPEARSRWMERKLNREKRFDKLQRGSNHSDDAPHSTLEGGEGKSPKRRNH